MKHPSLIVLALVLSPLVAQRPASESGTQLGAPQSMPAFVTNIHTQADDPEGGMYGIWAAGKDYKVSFHDGATFVPFLGGNYPHNQPFAWTTTSVTLGEEELVTREQPVAHQATDTRYEYDHGGVVEAYDVLLDGLEQTFVIQRAPTATGDLVVRGTVDTRLTAARVTGRHVAVKFVDHNGDLILTYGAATAIDAAGRRKPMTTSFSDGSFELELDSAWLANATYPVVVDPVLGPNTTLSTWAGLYGSTQSVDVLREDQRPTENVWICYTRAVSLTDSDMWVMRTNDNLPGTLILQAFNDITSSWSNGTCELAHCASRVICAFVREFPATRNIRWHAHHINDLASRTGYGSFTTTNNNWRVDIGGNRPSSPSQRAMVVFQHETGAAFANGLHSEIGGFYIDFAAATTTTAQGVVANPTSIFAGAPQDFERPRINQDADHAGSPRCVVYQILDQSVTGDDWDVVVDFWSNQGQLLDYEVLDPVTTPKHKLGPVVAGSNGRYLIAYAGADPGLVAAPANKIGTQLITQRVDFAAGAISLPHPAHSDYPPLLTPDIETLGIAYNTTSSSHWMVLSRAGSIIWADLMGYRGAGVDYCSFYLGSSFYTNYRAGCSYDDDNGSYVLVGSAQAVAGNPVFGNVWTTSTIPVPTIHGVGCSTGALAWSWDQHIGQEFSRVILTGVPTGSLAVLGVSLATANLGIGGIPGVGAGCTQLISSGGAFLGFLPIGFGSPTGQVLWPLPLNENFWPLTFHFQAFHLDASSLEFLSTHRLAVPIDN